MGLLKKLKSALGLDGAESPDASAASPGDVDVTVEREPSSASEDAVKGTETAASGPQGSAAGARGVAADEGIDGEHADVTDEATSAGDDATGESGSGDPVTEITGIGDAYGERLSGAGVETVADLAAADADELADETDIAAGRIEGWIESARAY